MPTGERPAGPVLIAAADQFVAGTQSGSTPVLPLHGTDRWPSVAACAFSAR